MNRKLLTKKPTRGYSFLGALTFSSLLLTILVTMLFGAMLLFNTRLLQKNSYDNMRQTLNVYNDQLSQTLHDELATMILYAQNNTDIGQLKYITDEGKIRSTSYRINNLYQSILAGFSCADGVFLSAGPENTLVYSSTDSNMPMMEYLKRAVEKQELAELPRTRWFLRVIKGDYYLLRIVDLKDCYTGVWFKLDRLEQVYSKFREDAIFMLIDQNGHPINNPLYSREIFDPSASLHEPITTSVDNTNYLQISTALNFCDYYLIALVPIRSIRQSQELLMFFSSAIILLFLLLTFIAFLAIRKVIMQPAMSIQETSRLVRGEDYSVKLAVDQRSCREVQELNESINSLIDRITTLQQNVYEERLTKTQLELQYLKSQVAPHFLINCFSILGGIPNTEEGQKLRSRMIQTLSDHLRYTLGQSESVTLEDELYYVENYIQLSDIRFPGCLSYETDIEADTLNASVFPLLVLMMTENSIKYNLIMGEPLLIRISCRLETEGDNTFLHIVHIDSGDGFPQSSLEILNRLGEENSNPIKTGHQIGMYNIQKRVHLIYGKNTSIIFSNEPGMGARIDIRIPYIPVFEETF